MGPMLVDEYHIGRLAAWLTDGAEDVAPPFYTLSSEVNDKVQGTELVAALHDPEKARSAVARILAARHLQCLEDYYGDNWHGHIAPYIDWRPNDNAKYKSERYIRACERMAAVPWTEAPHSAREILTGCRFYAYLTCQHRGWATSTARALVRRAAASARRVLGPEKDTGWPLRERGHAEGAGDGWPL